MKHIYLVRHGESESNVDVYVHLLKNDRDIALSPEGESQCIKAGDYFSKFLAENDLLDKNFRIFCSPFLRAKQTMDLMLSRVKDLQIQSSILDELLVEQDIDWGNVKTKEDIDKIVSDADISLAQELYFYRRIFKGESPCEVAERVKPFVMKDILNEDDSHIIIFSHGTLMRSIRHVLMQAKPEEFEYTPQNTAIKKLVIKNGKCSDEGWIYTP